MILNSLIVLLNQIGANTRIISLFLNNSISGDIERTALINFAMEYVKQHFFIGSFPICDRTVIFENVGAFAYLSDANSSYIHNIFLEWMIQFGGCIGMVLSISFSVAIVKSLFLAKLQEDKSLILIGVTIGFLPLMFSFSYIFYSCFYFLLGLLLSRKRNIE